MKEHNWSQTSPRTQDPHERAIEDQDLTVVCGSQEEEGTVYRPVFTLYQEEDQPVITAYKVEALPICPPQGVPGPSGPTCSDK